MLWKLTVILAVSAAALTAQTNTFTPIEYPGATMTHARSINDAGDVVGDYIDASGTHGFLLRGGKLTSIDFPGAKNTFAYGINSAGTISGYWGDGTKQHGFFLSAGNFTQVDCPGDGVTLMFGINAGGDLSGYFTPTGKPAQGVIFSRGACTLAEYRPDVSRRTMTMLYGMNDSGVAVGHWGTNGGSIHGVVYNKGAFSQVDHGSGGSVLAYGINNAGDVVGQFRDSSGRNHGFLMENGRFTQIDFPGAASTTVSGINNSGQVVGWMTDANNSSLMRGFVVRPAAAATPPPVITVDDDGADCPGALRTIQEAVGKAPAGATILVCAGTYRGTVKIVGPQKTALKLIAVGQVDEVVLQGDYTERDGFHLENVTNVVIRGFTVRDFGATATSATDWGAGNQIYLENADYNTIENNRLINGDMTGIMLVNSGQNTVQGNSSWVDNSSLANCGVHIGGTKSVNNLFMFNTTRDAKMAGFMFSGAGTGNRVLNNTVLSNGRDGIYISNTDSVYVEGNRVSYGRGPWGTTPYPKEQTGEGFGIRLVNSTGSTVVDNRSISNSGVDLNWDGKGTNRIETNACATSTPAGACAK